MTERFEGRRAFVTGGSRGIGEAIARRLAAEGADVTVAARGIEDARRVAGEIGGGAVELDVSDFEGVAEAVHSVGTLDVLVNNAGVDDFDFFTDTTPERWRQLLDVNLLGLMACTRAALPAMQQARYGRIVNISSEAGRLGSAGNAVYAASKGAIVSFTKSIARENARYGITANSLAVGPTDTQLFNANREIPRIGEKLVEGMIQATLLRRAGTVEEVAAAAAFLASDDASYITGENLGVSGGMGIATA